MGDLRVSSQTARYGLKDRSAMGSRIPFSPETSPDTTTMDDNSRFFPGRSPVARQSAEKVFESVRRDAVTALSGVLAGFWGDIEEQVRLAAIASHDNRGLYDDRMAIRLLNQRALELANRYREALETAFDAWRNPRPRAVGGKSLSLMSEAQLEIHLAGQQIVELLEHQLMHPLHLMHERLDALATALGLPRQAPETNPLRPDVPVQAFVKLFSEDDLTPELRRLIFLQLEKRLSKALDELYSKVNALLENGFAPREMPLPPQAAVPPQAPSAAGWLPDGGLVEPRGPQAGAPNHQAGYGQSPAQSWGQPGGQSMAGAQPDLGGQSMAGGQPMSGGMLSDGGRPLRYRESVHQQLRAWRQSVLRRGATPLPASSLVGVRVLAPQELLGIASMLQGDDPAPYVRALTGDDSRPLSAVIRDQIVSGSRQLGFDPTQTRFNEVDEDAIDLVGILLQTLARSHATLSRSRAMYGRLVGPYLKLALSDDSLFDQRAHPGRKLLEALSEACDGNTGESPQDQQTLTHAELAVDRVVEDYRDDKAIFELAAAELRDHLDQQKKVRDIAEQRAAEAVGGRERLQHARRAVDDLLASRLGQRPLTAGIAEFLTGHWRHHLVQTWLREGPSSAQYLSALSIGDGLMQADADAARCEGGRVADKILELQGPLGRCYAGCGLDATAARDSLARIVSALAFPDQPRMLHSLPEEESSVVEPADAATWGGLRVAAGNDAVEFDPALAARLRRLRVGQNLRLIEEDGRETAARIAWVSPLTARFLIVNRRGMRKLVVSPEELAALIGKGRVSMRTSEAPFDEAMRDMWQQLVQTRVAAS